MVTAQERIDILKERLGQRDKLLADVKQRETQLAEKLKESKISGLLFKIGTTVSAVLFVISDWGRIQRKTKRTILTPRNPFGLHGTSFSHDKLLFMINPLTPAAFTG